MDIMVCMMLTHYWLKFIYKPLFTIVNSVTEVLRNRVVLQYKIKINIKVYLLVG